MSDTILNQSQNLIVLRKRVEPAAHTIYQEDLEEYLLYTREMREAEKRWKDKRHALQKALRAGASVENGVHTAYFEPSNRNGYAVPPSSGFKFIVR